MKRILVYSVLLVLFIFLILKFFQDPVEDAVIVLRVAVLLREAVRLIEVAALLTKAVVVLHTEVIPLLPIKVVEALILRVVLIVRALLLRNIILYHSMT